MALQPDTPTAPGRPRITRRLPRSRPAAAPRGRPAPWDAPTDPRGAGPAPAGHPATPAPPATPAAPANPAPPARPAPSRFAPRASRPDRPRFPVLPGALARWRAPAADGARRALEARASHLCAGVGAALGLEITLDTLVPAAAGVALAGPGFAVSPGPGLPACTVRLCPTTASALVGAVAGIEAPPLATAPDRITRAVLGHAVLVALAAVAGEADEDAKAPLAPALAASPPGPPVLCFEARLRLGGRIGRIQVAVDGAGAARLDPRALPAARPLPPGLRAVPLHLELCAGPVRLSRATLDCLEAGDAVCPDPDLAYDGATLTGPAWLAAGGGAVALGRLDAGRLELTTLAPPSPRHREVPMSAPPPADALQVDLRVVLATVPATLGELAALEPGSVVPLPGPDPEVRLAVGDTVIARGSLVEVDGVLGVQVQATCAETRS